eukprot:790690-Prymnesium_polylepis.1
MAITDEERPDASVEEVYQKLACDEEYIMTNKTLDLGWKGLEPHHAAGLAEILKKASNCVNLKYASAARQPAHKLGEPLCAKKRRCRTPRAATFARRSMFVNEVGPKGGKAIAEALPHMPKLVQMDLQQWQVKPEGAKYIADAVAAHPRIKSLKMHYNHLGWDGTEYLAKAFAQHKTLTNLDLGDNGMDEMGARHLAAMLATNTSITRLE